jgi:hypothetical protein
MAPKPLPFASPYPKPKPKRLLRGKAVTIAAGFVCTEGLVLFADTEEQEGYIKTSVEKIRDLSVNGLNIAIANAGNGPLADALVDQIFDKLQTVKSNRSSVLQMLRSCIIEFHRDEVSLYPSGDDTRRVGLIIGLQIGSESPILLHADSSALRKVTEFAVIGYGAEIKFLAQQLYRENMPLRHGILIANHLCKTAKDYVQGCGGDSRIATISEGKIEIRHFFDVWTDESVFRALTSNYHAVMLSLGDEQISDEQFNNCIEWFAAEAWKERERMLSNKELNREVKERAKTMPPFSLAQYYEPVDLGMTESYRRSMFILQQAKKKMEAAAKPSASQK